MTKPVEDYNWATGTVAEYVSNNLGESVLVTNKAEPSTSAKTSGFRARAPLARQYYNYIINALGIWLTYTHEGEVGDVKLFVAGTSLATVEARFNNTWVDRGTDTIAGQTYQVFERTV